MLVGTLYLVAVTEGSEQGSVFGHVAVSLTRPSLGISKRFQESLFPAMIPG